MIEVLDMIAGHIANALLIGMIAVPLWVPFVFWLEFYLQTLPQ